MVSEIFLNEHDGFVGTNMSEGQNITVYKETISIQTAIVCALFYINVIHINLSYL